MNSDWRFSKEYQKATKAEKDILDSLIDILYDVQYAKTGRKAAKRREAALTIAYVVKHAYKLHQSYKAPKKVKI